MMHRESFKKFAGRNEEIGGRGGGAGGGRAIRLTVMLSARDRGRRAEGCLSQFNISERPFTGRSFPKQNNPKMETVYGSLLMRLRTAGTRISVGLRIPLSNYNAA